MAYTEEELAGLSDEEREALEADDQDEEEAEILKEIADGQEEEETEAKAEAGGGDDAAMEDHPEASDEEAADFQPQYLAAPVEDYEAKMTALAEQKKALRAKLNEGEITLDEYEEQKDAALDQERTLREQQFKAQIAAEQNQQTALQRWQWEQERFFGEERNAIYKDKYLLVAFDAAVKDLAADEKNANRSAQWFLSEADKMVRGRFAPADKAGEKPAGKAVEQPTKPNRRPDLSVVPKTLGQLPAAELPETGGGEFDHLEKLDGLALEQAVARMTPEQQQRYLVG